MRTINCEACNGVGKIEYTQGSRLRDCKICKGTGQIEITDEDFEKLEDQES